MNTLNNIAKGAYREELAQRIIPALFGIFLGSFLLLGVGFADSHLIHNAAHDARHAHSFPCH
jgi:cobalt transporter subunit CbtB